MDSICWYTKNSSILYLTNWLISYIIFVYLVVLMVVGISMSPCKGQLLGSNFCGLHVNRFVCRFIVQDNSYQPFLVIVSQRISHGIIHNNLVVPFFFRCSFKCNLCIFPAEQYQCMSGSRKKVHSLKILPWCTCPYPKCSVNEWSIWVLKSLVDKFVKF